MNISKMFHPKRREMLSLCIGAAACLTLLTAAPTASAQRITARNMVVDCGNVQYEKPVTAEFELKNSGRRKLVISDVKVSCGCMAADFPTTEIAAGDRFTLLLTYDARQLGHFVKTAAIYSNASDKPVYITMKGVVQAEVEDFAGLYPYTFGSLVADKNNLEFDNVNKGDAPSDIIYIRNTGEQTLFPNLLHLPDYLTADVSPTSLTPGRAGKITVTLNSAALRDYGLTQTSVYLANQLGEKVSDDTELPVSAVLLPAFDDMSSAERQNAPRLQLSADSMVFSFEGKRKKKGEIRLTNAGRTTLKISSLQMFTGGLRVTLGKRNIEPGETTELKITGYADELRKARSKPRVLMITNDPDRPKLTINIIAR